MGASAPRSTNLAVALPLPADITVFGSTLDANQPAAVFYSSLPWPWWVDVPAN